MTKPQTDQSDSAGNDVGAATGGVAQKPVPLDPSLQKAGEILLSQSLESHREICKSMISTTTVSLGAYVGLLGLVADKTQLIQFLKSNLSLSSAPVILFAVAASMYICGYFHSAKANPRQLVEWLRDCDARSIEEATQRTLSRRWSFLWAGNIAYWMGVAVALYAIYRCLVP